MYVVCMYVCMFAWQYMHTGLKVHLYYEYACVYVWVIRTCVH